MTTVFFIYTQLALQRHAERRKRLENEIKVQKECTYLPSMPSCKLGLSVGQEQCDNYSITLKVPHCYCFVLCSFYFIFNFLRRPVIPFVINFCMTVFQPLGIKQAVFVAVSLRLFCSDWTVASQVK